MNIKREIDSNGELKKNTSYAFLFKKPVFSYESYKGENLNINYFIRTTITKSIFQTKLITDKHFKVISPIDTSIHRMLISKMTNQIGFKTKNEMNINITFELTKNKVDLIEGVNGRLIFNDITKVPIRSIDIYLIKSEKILNNVDNFIVNKYELCDGQPWTKEEIPLRFYTYKMNISPTMKNVNNNKCSIRYYIKIVIYCDEDNDNAQLTKMFEVFFYRSTNNYNNKEIDF